MADYSAASYTNSQRDPKKPRTAEGIPSEVSISGQSDLEASMASSYDQFRQDDTELLQGEQEMMDLVTNIAEADDTGNNDEEERSNNNDNDEEPHWDKLCQYEPSKNEIQTFLSIREKRDYASNRCASAIDQLHDSVSSHMEELITTVEELYQTKSTSLEEYERALNYDYVVNEKRRGEMQSKLEESARAAQGLFANLLMRIAQPADLLGGNSSRGQGVSGEGGDAAKNDDAENGDDKEEMSDQEPDWDSIVLHEPAKTEVPIYLEARNRREAASARFDTAIQDFQHYTEECLQDLTQAMVDMYNERSAKLDEYECMLKQEYVHNDEVRTKMQTQIEESANAASQMFETLMSRVLQQESPSTQGIQTGAGTLTQATTLNSP